MIPIFLAVTMAGSVPGVAAEPTTTAVAGQGDGSAVRSEAGGTTNGTGPEKLICKREKVSGSRTASARVCQTAAEWERQRRTDQQAVEKIQGARWKSN